MASEEAEDSTYEQTVEDLEIKDAGLIFKTVWNEIANEVGEHSMRFPKEIFWLNGAPGAGKGTNTRFIMKYRGITAEPIVISDLLKSPEAIKRKDAGLMAGDREVLSLLLRKLMSPEYANGAIIDGFPRTMVQVECLKLFYHKLVHLRASALHTADSNQFVKPQFHIIVLFIDEAESVRRQLYRGDQAKIHNAKVKESGVGHLLEIRKTDMDETAARTRYRTFKELTYDSLRSLKKVFYYHFINAHGTVEQVQARIIDELKYQSSLELSQNTFDRLNRLPLASEIVKHARQQLVYRLDDYEANHTELFEKVVSLIELKFMPIVHRHAISGEAVVNTEDEVLSQPLALAMLIDIFSERGYHAIIDIRQEEIPKRMGFTGIKMRMKRVYRVKLRFNGCDIRRGG